MLVLLWCLWSPKKGEAAPPKTTIRVCNSLSCELYGSIELKDDLSKRYKNKDIRILNAPCMGRCASAPVIEIGHYHLEKADLEKVDQAIQNKLTKPIIPDYECFDDYINKGGYMNKCVCGTTLIYVPPVRRGRAALTARRRPPLRRRAETWAAQRERGASPHSKKATHVIFVDQICKRGT